MGKVGVKPKPKPHKLKMYQVFKLILAYEQVTPTFDCIHLDRLSCFNVSCFTVTISVAMFLVFKWLLVHAMICVYWLFNKWEGRNKLHPDGSDFPSDNFHSENFHFQFLITYEQLSVEKPLGSTPVTPIFLLITFTFIFAYAQVLVEKLLRSTPVTRIFLLIRYNHHLG